MKIERYFAAVDLAGLPGMPLSARAVSLRAKKADWPRRKRPGRAGAWEYPEYCLPAETQEHLRQQRVLVEVNEALADMSAPGEAIMLPPTLEELSAKADEARKQRQVNAGKFAALPPGSSKRLDADSRYAIISALETFRSGYGCDKAESRRLFVAALEAGRVDGLSDEVLAVYPVRTGVRDPRLLARWERQLALHGRWGLVDNYGNRSGQGAFGRHERVDERGRGRNAMREKAIGALFKYPQFSQVLLREYLQAKGFTVPGLRTVGRWMNAWKQDNAPLWSYLTNPDEWKNVHMAAVGSQHEAITALHQMWEEDGSPFDIMATDGRFTLMGVIDMYSRSGKALLEPTSTAMGLNRVTRRGLVDWRAVPDTIRTDNGADYISRLFAAALRDLGIEQELCVPFASEEKGTVERFMQTIMHGCLSLLPGFIGHSVADRKAIEGRRSFAARTTEERPLIEVSLSSTELQERINQWIDVVYDHAPHRGEGMDGKSPFQRRTEWTGAIRQITDIRALDMLLSDIAGERVIGKKGIAYQHHHYSCPELFSTDRGTGHTVKLKHDEAEIGRLYAYDSKGFVGVVECPELLGISRAEHAMAIKHAQKAYRTEAAAEAREYTKTIKQNPTDAILEWRAAQSENVTAFPRPTEAHSTAALDAAAAAVRADDARQNPEAPGVDDAAHQALKSDFAEREKAEVIAVDDPLKTHAYWVSVERRGDVVSKTEREGLRYYVASGKYESNQETFDLFPDDLDIDKFIAMQA